MKGEQPKNQHPWLPLRFQTKKSGINKTNNRIPNYRFTKQMDRWGFVGFEYLFIYLFCEEQKRRWWETPMRLCRCNPPKGKRVLTSTHVLYFCIFLVSLFLFFVFLHDFNFQNFINFYFLFFFKKFLNHLLGFESKI